MLPQHAEDKYYYISQLNLHSFVVKRVKYIMASVEIFRILNMVLGGKKRL